MMRRCFGRLGDTCCYTSGWGVRGVSSSIFWQFFEFVRFLFRFAVGVFHICKNLGERLWEFSLHFPVSFLQSLIFSFCVLRFLSILVHPGFVEFVV